MKKELNINLKNETEDEIKIKIGPDYAEILTDEDRAYLKGNFEKLNGRIFSTSLSIFTYSPAEKVKSKI